MQVIEWAAFSLLPGVTENTLLQAASAMQHQFLDVQGGCLSRHLVQLGQGAMRISSPGNHRRLPVPPWRRPAGRLPARPTSG